MKKDNLRLFFSSVVFLIVAAVSVSPGFAHTPVTHHYQVSSSSANSDATVQTSVTKDLISVVIQQKNQPTHYYNSYLEVKVSTARIGKNTLFTIYHNDQRVESGRFDKKFSESSGTARSKQKEIIFVREKLETDMRILRAVRAFDENSDVILAELSYAIVTYDNSKIDAADDAALKGFTISKNAQPANIAVKKDASRYKADKAELARVYKTVSLTTMQDTLDGCLQGAYDRYNECKNDTAIADKSICYNNRSSEVQTCHRTYGDKKVDTEESNS